MGGPVGGEEKICAGRKWSGGVFLSLLLPLLLLHEGRIVGPALEDARLPARTTGAPSFGNEDALAASSLPA